MRAVRSSEVDFEAFVREVEPRLRRALVAAYGLQAGRDASVDALAWAWVHRDRLAGMDNPVGYLYRVGQSRAREDRRPLRAAPDDGGGPRSGSPGSSGTEIPWIEPELEPALMALSQHQRVAVVLCHGFGWTHREVAELLDLSASTIQNHVERGLAHLRRALKVSRDV